MDGKKNHGTVIPPLSDRFDMSSVAKQIHVMFKQSYSLSLFNVRTSFSRWD